MKLPDSFPAGCRFVPTFGGDWFVEFPAGNVFKLSDDGKSLVPAKVLPRGGVAVTSDPAGLLAAAKAAS